MDNTIRIGDVFEMFDGPFSTAIVTAIHDDGSFDAERPMMQITGIEGHPNPCVSIERMTKLRPDAPFVWHKYRDGHDNRWYHKR